MCVSIEGNTRLKESQKPFSIQWQMERGDVTWRREAAGKGGRKEVVDEKGEGRSRRKGSMEGGKTGRKNGRRKFCRRRRLTRRSVESRRSGFCTTTDTAQFSSFVLS